jgi:hypothetical protein
MDDMKEKVMALRAEGKTFRAISKELGISLGQAHKLSKGGKQSSEETIPHRPPARYTDCEGRFLDILTNYGVGQKEAETAVELIGAFGETVFTDPGKLMAALRETTLSPSKRASVLRHWCRTQGLAVPVGADPVPSDRHNDGQRPERFFYDPSSRSILPDPEGPYSWSQAYQLRLSDQPRQSGGDDGMKRLEERLAGLERSVVEGREKSLLDEVTRLRQEIATSKEGRSAISDLDVMGKGIDHISKQLEGGRSDIKELLFFLLKQPPRPMSRAERDFVESAISSELAKEGQVSRLDELARQALGEEFRHPSHPEQGMAAPVENKGDIRAPVSYE